MYYDTTNYYDASPRLNTNGDYCGVDRPRGNCDCTECTRLRRLIQHNQPLDAHNNVILRDPQSWQYQPQSQQLLEVPRPDNAIVSQPSNAIVPKQKSATAEKMIPTISTMIGDITHEKLAMLVVFLYVIIVFLAYQHYALMQVLKQHSAIVASASVNQ